MYPWVSGQPMSSARLKANAGDYQTAGGTADAITLTAGAASTYTAGDFYVFKAGGTNTGPATLNVSAFGAKSIKNTNGQDLAAGQIVNGDIVTVFYDGTNFQLVSPNREVTAVIQGTRAMNAASSTQSIAHGLGTTPSRIEIHAVCTTSVEAFQDRPPIHSHGYSDGSVDKCTWQGEDNNGGSSSTIIVGNEAAEVAHLELADTATTQGEQAATASFDATNVDLVWTKAGTGTADVINFTIIVFP